MNIATLKLDPSLELFENNSSYNSSYLRITRDSDPTDILICILFYDEKLKMNFTCKISVYIIIIPLQCSDISVTIYSNVVGRILIRKSCQHRLIIIRRSMKY